MPGRCKIVTWSFEIGFSLSPFSFVMLIPRPLGTSRCPTRTGQSERENHFVQEIQGSDGS